MPYRQPVDVRVLEGVVAPTAFGIGTTVYLLAQGASHELAADLPAGLYELTTSTPCCFVVTPAGGGGAATYFAGGSVPIAVGERRPLLLAVASRLACITDGVVADGTLAVTELLNYSVALSGKEAPMQTRSIIASSPIADGDYQIFADATTGDLTATLPTAVGRAGKEFRVKCTNAVGGHVTIASAGGLVEGAATYLMVYGQSVTICGDGADWYFV